MRPDKRANLEVYDAYAEEYMQKSADYWDKFPEAQRVILAFSIALLDEKLLKSRRILDLGSGGGGDSALFRKAGFDPLCLDFSPKMLKIAKGKGLNTVLMDIEHLGFQDNSFDGVWAYASLLHIPHEILPSVLKNVRRILRPGGVFLASMVGGQGEDWRRSERMQNAMRYFALWSVEDFMRELESAGFSVEEVFYPVDNFFDVLCRANK